MISLKEIIKRSNDIDKIKAFLFDSNMINVFENLGNPPLKYFKKESNQYWIETIFEEEDLDGNNFDKKAAEIATKNHKNFMENNFERVLSFIDN